MAALEIENNALDRYKVTIPAYQHTIPETYTDEELTILLDKPKGSCTEVEYETWVFINIRQTVNKKFCYPPHTLQTL